MTKAFNLKKNAFTLIELLIFMGIFSGLTLVCTQLLASVLEVQTESKTLTNVQLDGNYLSSRISYDLTRADSIDLPASLGDQTTSLQLTIDGGTYSFSLNNGNLILTHPGGSDALNSYDSVISGLTFLRLGNSNGKNSIRINYTVTSRTQKASGSEAKSYQTTIGTR